MEACLEALLEMDFCTKPPNIGVEAHMEAPAGDAIRHDRGRVTISVFIVRRRSREYHMSEFYIALFKKCDRIFLCAPRSYDVCHAEQPALAQLQTGGRSSEI
jgi:hypothetical protein